MSTGSVPRKKRSDLPSLEQSQAKLGGLMGETKVEAVGAPTQTAASDRVRQAAEARARLDQGAPGRQSNIDVSEELRMRVAELQSRLGRSHGDLIVMAVEAEYEKLKDAPRRDVIGGTIFAARPPAERGVPKKSPVAKVVLTFRMREADYAQLDALATDSHFTSRTELIAACLEAFCDDQKIPKA